MISASRVIYMGIDVQKAFGSQAKSARLATLASQPEGDEEQEIHNNARLASAVYAAGGTIIVSKDWHNPVGTKVGDLVDNRAADEFAVYGEHATEADGDSDLNAPLESALQNLEAQDGHTRTILPVDEHEVAKGGDSRRIFEVHKNVYDVTQREVLLDSVEQGPMVPNQAFLALIRDQVADARGPVTMVLGGKIAEVCVRAGVLSLLAAIPGLKMMVPEDAVSSLPSELAHKLQLADKNQVLQELRSHGVEIVKTQQVLDWLVT